MTSREGNVERELLARTKKLNELMKENTELKNKLTDKTKLLKRLENQRLKEAGEFREKLYQKSEECEEYKRKYEQIKLYLEHMEVKKMSKADEMFKELGYIKEDKINHFKEKWGESFYNKNNLAEITFDFEDKEICVYCRETDEAVYFNLDLLQVINEKCKELGWLK